jgi:hypothetical protein
MTEELTPDQLALMRVSKWVLKLVERIVALEARCAALEARPWGL